MEFLGRSLCFSHMPKYEFRSGRLYSWKQVKKAFRISGMMMRWLQYSNDAFRDERGGRQWRACIAYVDISIEEHESMAVELNKVEVA